MEETIRWYQKLRFRSIAAAMVAVACAIAVFLILLTYQLQDYWVRQKITEITRYAGFVASDMAMAEADQAASNAKTASDEVENFTRLNAGEHMIILDDKARVLQDSSKTKVGAYIINDDILEALAGRRVLARDSGYLRIAIPITDRYSSKVIGVVYVLSTLNSMQSVANALRTPIAVLVILVLVGLFLLYCIWIIRLIRPLDQINEWLRKKADGHLDLVPEQHYQGEYREIVGSVQEITRDLMELDVNRKTFVSNVSHELKTPLSSIKVLTEALLIQDEVPEEVYKDFLTDINTEIDRQNSIITDLLTLVRLDESEKSMNITTCTLNDLLESILKRLQPLTVEKHIDLILDSARTVTQQCDEMKLTLALSNLIENGIKYNQENGSVRVRIDAGLRHARITVSDTGIGIAKEHFPRLYDRFYRVDKARDREAGGTGLGLSIVKQVIMLHHGTISVDSRVGEGTTFYITLPLKYAPPREDVSGEE